MNSRFAKGGFPPYQLYGLGLRVYNGLLGPGKAGPEQTELSPVPWK